MLRGEKIRKLRKVINMNVEGRPKKKWLDAIGCDIRTAGVDVDNVGNWVKWSFRT